MSKTLPIDQMIDSQRGIISREIFVSPEFHKEELEKLFTRAWLFVGHESQISKPGDFFVSRMGQESVILCRDSRGEVHVFLNSCRHRGMKVCRYEQGNTSLFVCPYHSWSYTTDGKLQGVPLYRSLYEGVLNRDEWSLVEVPRLSLYKGTVWAFRWASDDDPASLYFERNDNGIVVASEPFDQHREAWVHVPPGHALIARPGESMEMPPMKVV